MKKRNKSRHIALLTALLMILSSLMTVGAGAQELEIADDCIILDAPQIYERMTAYDKVSVDLCGESELGLLELAAKEQTDKVGFYLELGGGLDDLKYISFIVKSSYAGTKFRIRLKDAAGDYTKTVKADSNYAESSWWQSITVNLSTSDAWKGNNEAVAVDLLSGFDFDVGASCQVAAIFLCKTPEKVSELASEFFGGQISAVQQFSDFGELEVGYFNQGAYQTSVGVMSGNVIYEGTGVTGTSDPFATWAYKDFAVSRGTTPLNAEDFCYLVVRYRCQHETKKITFNIYYQTGERTQAVWNCHSGESYKPSMTWRCVVVSFEGKPEWSGSVNSLRVDWADSIPANTYARFEVAEFLFFDDLDEAKLYANAINNMKITDPEISVEEDTYEGDTEDELLPWETETELVSEEETLPEYIEEGAETEKSESSENSDGEEVTEEEKLDDTKKPEDSTSDGEQTEKEGSNIPFVIACVLLIALSVASVVTVLVIRARDKKEK